MSLYELRSSKRSKPIGNSKSASAKGELFTIARITNQLEIIIKVEEEVEDITRLIQSYILNPSRLQLIKESLL